MGKSIFELLFADKLGKKCTIMEEGEYYCGDYISGRFYTGILKHIKQSKNGLVLTIDNNNITIDVHKSKLTFYEK